MGEESSQVKSSQVVTVTDYIAMELSKSTYIYQLPLLMQRVLLYKKLPTLSETRFNEHDKSKKQSISLTLR